SDFQISGSAISSHKNIHFLHIHPHNPCFYIPNQFLTIPLKAVPAASAAASVTVTVPSVQKQPCAAFSRRLSCNPPSSW
ncbi:hypothetical protein, partial [Faecalibaculum rodentium]|uniref:hypothetical protein n=1 Tax=Faecalibaculum rodentium TaxID=1702221 RepID=UPI0026F3AACC